MIFVLSVLFSFVLYLVLTAGSGTVIYWSYSELLLGAVLALATGIISSRLFSGFDAKADSRFLNPVRWLLFIVYIIGPFFFAMAKANFHVAYHVLMGKIRPGIVKIKPGLRTSLGTTMLADSITLTPGTLTVEVEGNDLHVHCIHLKSRKPDIKEVCGNFPEWVRRIVE